MKYRVTIPFACYVSVEVEADNPEEAEEIAMHEAYITGYCGNGGTDKLIGVDGNGLSIEAGEETLDMEPFSVHVQEIE